MIGRSLAPAMLRMWNLMPTLGPISAQHPGMVRMKYRGGRPPRGKAYPNANARGISPKVHKRFQEAANLLETAIQDAYLNGLGNDATIWDKKATLGAYVHIREASPAAVLSDMMDCSADVFDRLRSMARLYFPDGHKRAATLALKILRNKRRVWNRKVPAKAA